MTVTRDLIVFTVIVSVITSSIAASIPVQQPSVNTFFPGDLEGLDENGIPKGVYDLPSTPGSYKVNNNITKDKLAVGSFLFANYCNFGVWYASSTDGKGRTPPVFVQAGSSYNRPYTAWPHASHAVYIGFHPELRTPFQAEYGMDVTARRITYNFSRRDGDWFRSRGMGWAFLGSSCPQIHCPAYAARCGGVYPDYGTASWYTCSTIYNSVAWICHG